MSRYCEWLFLQGDAPCAARYVIYGVCVLKDWRSRDPAILPLSKMTLEGFVRKTPESMRDPIPYPAVWLIANRIFEAGDQLSNVLAACLCLIAADCYLRPSEGLDLLVKHVLPPRGRAGVLHYVLEIYPQGGAKPAKNKQFDLGVVVGAHGRDYVADIVKSLSANRAKDERIFEGLSLSMLERFFRQHRHGLCGGETPHGLRHTGPSHDAYYHKDALVDIQIRGR